MMVLFSIYRIDRELCAVRLLRGTSLSTERYSYLYHPPHITRSSPIPSPCDIVALTPRQARSNTHPRSSSSSWTQRSPLEGNLAAPEAPVSIQAPQRELSPVPAREKKKLSGYEMVDADLSENSPLGNLLVFSPGLYHLWL